MKKFSVRFIGLGIIALLAVWLLAGCDLFGLGVVGKWSATYTVNTTNGGTATVTEEREIKLDKSFTETYTVAGKKYSPYSNTYTSTSNTISFQYDEGTWDCDYMVSSTTLVLTWTGSSGAKYSLTYTRQ